MKNISWAELIIFYYVTVSVLVLLFVQMLIARFSSIIMPFFKLFFWIILLKRSLILSCVVFGFIITVSSLRSSAFLFHFRLFTILMSCFVSSSLHSALYRFAVVCSSPSDLFSFFLIHFPSSYLPQRICQKI